MDVITSNECTGTCRYDISTGYRTVDMMVELRESLWRIPMAFLELIKLEEKKLQVKVHISVNTTERLKNKNSILGSAFFFTIYKKVKINLC